MRVRVYYNLHKRVWSVQHYLPGKGWRVREHVLRINLRNVTFHVSERGRQRVLREQRKNVHAYAIGWSSDVPALYQGERISYNPYKGPDFMMAGQPVDSVPFAAFLKNRQVFACQKAG
jgi:hypothetical protein